MIPFADKAVEQAFARFELEARQGLLDLRNLIFDIAAEESLEITETLKWGQPAYLSPKGSTLRLGVPKAGGFALYAHCQSTVISDFSERFGQDDQFEGNRAVLFDHPSEIDPVRHGHQISHALSYHQK